MKSVLNMFLGFFGHQDLKAVNTYANVEFQMQLTG